jgi:EAL and modified HD-GYP domain-containing signal transduction protein
MAYYKNLLTGALQNYSLHNIKLTCTLSIGMSIIPEHGTKFSDVLRKADIAMYKAKTNGRNQIFFFEDQYLVARKFKDLFINIQPVLISSGKTYGYELVDGESTETEKDEPNTVCLSEINRAMDALSLGDINNKSYYFITYSKQLLSPAVLGNLQKDKFIIMLPNSSRLSKEELQTYLELKSKGYSLALSGVKNVAAVKPLLSIANYCKISPKEKSPLILKEIKEINPSVKLIASQVNTLTDFDAAKNAGYHLFQGYFFNQPVVVKKTKDIDPLKVNYLRLLKLSGTNDYMDFREISNIIASDVALTYKLLRILNSAAVGLRNVSSMAMAVAYMGEESLKKWIAVLALRGIAENKPLELVRMSLIRARFGELLAPHLRVKRNPDQVFMVGMLSLLHIALEKTKEQMLEEMPVSEEIQESLLTRGGIHSELLRFFESYEYSNWDEVSRFIADNRLDSEFVNDSYLSAVKWYNELTAPTDSSFAAKK